VGGFLKITRITQQNFSAFQGILPSDDHHYQSAQLWGCVEDDSAVGTAMLYVTRDACSLSWLWVAPEHRRRGAGGALLDEVCRFASGTPAQRLTVSYPADAPWAAAMEYMLLKRGFMVFVHAYPRYCFSREQLLAAPFLDHAGETPDPCVVPLSALTEHQLRRLAMENRQLRNYAVSHADFGRADAERSMALLLKEQIRGLLLVSTAGAEDILNLDLLYLKQPSASGGLTLLRQAAHTALRHPAGLRELRFICTGESGVRICRRLMGERAEPAELRVCHGTLYFAQQQERNDGHGREK